MIAFELFLDLMISRTLAPSPIGHQLSSMRDAEAPKGPKQKGPLDAQPTGGSAHGGSFNDAPAIARAMCEGEVHRCYDLLLDKGPALNGPWGRVYPYLAKVFHTSKLPMGFITIKLLRTYQEFGTRSQHRGMVRVYRWLSEVCPKVYKPLEGTEDEQIASFMDPNDKDGAKALKFAAEAYGDALMAAEHHVKMWNKQPIQVAS